MSSNIITTGINTNFPVQGQDNPSQGFRDNFGNIVAQLDIAASEISDLQDLVVGTAIATTSTLGNVIIGSNLTITSEGVLSAVGSGFYSLPAASGSTLGGIKVGSGLTIAGDGTLSSIYSYSLPTASNSTLGGVKIGSGITITNGVISVPPGAYTLPTATDTELGGVKIGSGIDITDGVISVTPGNYTLPAATVSSLGGIKVGSGLDVTEDGLLSTTFSYSLPIASNLVLGGIKIGSGLSIAGDGTVSVTGGGGGGGVSSSVAFSNIAVTGQSTVSANTVSDTVNFVAGAGIAIATNTGTKSVTVSTNLNPIRARMTSAYTIPNLSPNNTASITITGFKGYLLYKVAATTASWVRLYVSTAARTADASRSIDTDPSPGSGVIAEVITTNSNTVIMAPGVFGFSNESPPKTNIPITVTNQSANTASITVTLTLLQLEA